MKKILKFFKIKKYNDFVSIAVDFVVLNTLLIVINAYTLINGHNDNWWYVTIALPIVTLIYLAINALICVRFLRINKHLKTLLLWDLTFISTRLTKSMQTIR